MMENDDSAVRKFKGYLHSTFDIKDLGPPKYFFDIEKAQSDKGLCLSQQKLFWKLYQKQECQDQLSYLMNKMPS